MNHIDLEALPLRRVCNVVWFRLVEHANEKQRAKVEAELMRPLPGQSERVSQKVVNFELQMFERALKSGLAGTG